jgi:putative ABC transport system substrate-binding protein
MVMIQFRKASLPLWILVAVASTTLMITDTTSVPAGSDGEGALETRFNIGKPAPGFTLENLLGDKISLKDFRGSVLVLAFGFSKKTAKDPEEYRSRIMSDFKDEAVKFLKLIHINKPLFLTENFILEKMKKEFSTEEPLVYSAIDWGGSLGLDEKYGITDKDSPTLIVVGREGRILYGLTGWYSDANLRKIEKEISTILEVGEDAYLGHSSAGPEKTYHIGVTRIMYHPSFVWTDRGFRDALEEAGFVEGKNVVYDFQDVKADPKKIVPIGNEFVRKKVDLIHSMSIMTSQELVKIVKEIPLVYSMVMDPIEEEVVATMGPTGTNVTGVGTSICALEDRWPVQSQMEMYCKFLPKAKRWGTIHNSESVNSRFHIKELRQVANRMGLELVEAPVTKEAEVKAAAGLLVGKVDAIYSTSDQMAMSRFEEIADVCNENRIPLFGGEIECVARGAAAAYNQDYYFVGYKAGQKAARILKGEKPGDIPSELTKKFHLVISRKNAETQGVTIPEDVLKMADQVL